jgi:hypothetical protein
MKTLNFEKNQSIFAEFTLSNVEMINVRGGGNEGGVVPVTPPIKI